MSHLVIFGRVSEDLEEKVIELRRKVRKLGYDSGEAYIDTLPHLTLAVHPKFIGETNNLKQKIENLDIKKFNLRVKDFIIVDNNAAVSFDNSHSVMIAKKIAFDLKGLGFEAVETYFMKMIRSEVKKEFQEKVKEMLKGIIPSEVEIIKISAARGNLTNKDIYWSINLL